MRHNRSSDASPKPFTSRYILQFRYTKIGSRRHRHLPTVGLSHSRLIDPAALAREAEVDAINLEIYHFPSGEARQLHNGGIAAFLHVPPPGRLSSLKSYGVDVEADVVAWIRDGLLDQLISNDVSQVVRLKDEANA